MYNKTMKKIMHNNTRSKNCFNVKKIVNISSIFVLLFSILLIGVTTNNNTSAVTYQTGVGVSFTFNPKLILTLSSSNLVISNLAPGTSDNSNEIAITVSTNAAYGYNLSATVGNSTTYNNTDLTHTSGSSAGKFTSIAYESNPSNYISSFTTDNTWGYSIDSGTKYNGLPLYSDTTNIATLKSTDTTPSTGTDTVNFLIGAKASTTQPTGDYNNIINFIAVTNPVPDPPLTIATATYLQDVEACPAYLQTEQVYTLKDKRDEQEYKVAKLKDGKCWMVENLNIAGGTALSSTDTDFDASYTLPTTDGWTVSDGKLVLPASAIKNANDNNLTDSTQFSTDNYAYVFNSGNKENCGASGQNVPCYSYYSWDTVTLGSGRTLATENTDADYSICPKGWRLPTSGNTSDNGWKRGDFYAIASSYGSDQESSNYDPSAATGANFYDNAGPNTTPDFLLVGYYLGGSFSGGGLNCGYWSATSGPSSTIAHYLSFSSSFVNSANFNTHKFGFSVRCLLKTN